MKSMFHALKEKGPTIGTGYPGEPSADFFRTEYEMNYQLHCSAVPQVRAMQTKSLLLHFTLHTVHGRCRSGMVL